MIGDWIVVEWAPSDTPFDPSPTWVDITEHVRALNIERGRSGNINEYQVGQLTLEVENGHSGTAPWIDQETLYRWRQVRVRLDDGGSNAGPMFYGYVVDILHPVVGGPGPSTATIRASDLLEALTRCSAVSLSDYTTSPDGYELQMGELVTNIENFIQFSVIGTELDTDAVSNAWIFFDADNYAANTNRDNIPLLQGQALDLFSEALRVESGSIHAGADGKLVVNGRWSALKTLSAAAAFVVSDTPATGEYVAEIGSLQIAQPGVDYWNAIEATGHETPIAYASTQAPGEFYEALSRTGLKTKRSAWVEADANLWATLYGQPSTWPAQLSMLLWPIDADNGGAVAAKDVVDATNYLGRTWVQVEVTPTGSTQRTWRAVVEGVTHSITSSRWTATLRFSSGDRWDVYGDWSTDYAVLGSWELGTHRLAP